MKKISSLKLNSGFDMPVVGLGTWQAETGLVGKAVKYALTEAGYTHIDGAKIYGNEPEIGEAYSEAFKTVNRKDVFITSKLWNDAHNPKVVEKNCRQTLKDLQLEYLDMYLIHWGLAFDPNPSAKKKNNRVALEKVTIQQTWQAMEKLVEQGLVRSIGVSNFNVPMLLDLLTYAKIVPAVNQIELHPYNAQTELVELCQSLDIQLTAYSPLGSPGNAGKDNIKIIENPTVITLAKKYHKTPAQVLIRWAIDRQTVVIPKSTTPTRIKENLDVFDFELTKDEVKQIAALNKNLRYVNPLGWGIPYFN